MGRVALLGQLLSLSPQVPNRHVRGISHKVDVPARVEVKIIAGASKGQSVARASGIECNEVVPSAGVSAVPFLVLFLPFQTFYSQGGNILQ